MIPGFLHRFNDELTELIKLPTYANRLGIKQFHFHSPPAQLNYTAWLGGQFHSFEIQMTLQTFFLGSLFGAIDTLDSQAIHREKYLQNRVLPDWFTDQRNV